MPIDPTPLEQEDEVAEATTLTDDPTALPFPGLLIVTPAKAETESKPQAQRQTHREAYFLISTNVSPESFCFLNPAKLLTTHGILLGRRSDTPATQWPVN
jgi:hypothetical protein